jgi:hypothetical protein
VLSGRYRIERRLGSGGGGHVFAALDLRTGERLALKLRHARTDARAALHAAQFEREYHTLSQLAHPAIVEVFDYGVDGEHAYYTLELLDGQDLRALGPLPVSEACRVLRDLASALSVLCSRKLVHRDLSTHNVRRTSDGRTKLIDFGAMAPMGVSTVIVGTPPFVPPEALALQALDGRSDLYALGALAYFLLSGRDAYPAAELRELEALWRAPPPPPLRSLVPELPEALESLVHQLLSLDRTARPASAAAVMERLTATAGLPADEAIDVRRAHLAVPVLVGREALLRDARELVASAAQGRGGALVLEGARGSGRSRALDACVLEAKLLGALVLRTDLAHGLTGDYGVARAWLEQLERALPSAVARSSDVGEALRQELSTASALPEPERSNARRGLHVRLRDLLLGVASERALLIAIDDADGIDQASLALLAALADGAPGRRLALVLTREAAGA